MWTVDACIFLFIFGLSVWLLLRRGTTLYTASHALLREDIIHIHAKFICQKAKPGTYMLLARTMYINEKPLPCFEWCMQSQCRRPHGWHEKWRIKLWYACYVKLNIRIYLPLWRMVTFGSREPQLCSRWHIYFINRRPQRCMQYLWQISKFRVNTHTSSETDTMNMNHHYNHCCSRMYVQCPWYTDKRIKHQNINTICHVGVIVSANVHDGNETQ